MKKLLVLLPLFFFLASCEKEESCTFPSRPMPQRLVNDHANVFTPDQVASLEQLLERYSVSTSTDICIYTTNDLCDYEPSTFAFKIIDDWGIGNAEKDNGLLILLKPKETAVDEKGDVFIATGRGLEGVIPDAKAKRIAEDEMIPYFKAGQYYEGVLRGVQLCMELADKDFEPAVNVPAANSPRREDIIGLLPAFGIVALILLFVVLPRIASTRKYARTNHIGFWAAWFLLNSGRGGRGGGGWGGFGGFGGGGGGGGGWGGFGGGSSGGGGSGGSW